MKKILNSVMAAAALLTLVLACNKEDGLDVVKPGKTVTINATIDDLATKVSFTPGYDAIYGKPESMALAWAEGDQIRIYNHADRKQYSDFALDAECIGQKAGRFTGTLVEAASYDLEIINGSFSYSAQTQPSDGVTTGLKYLASASGVTDVTNVVFSDFSSVLAITAQMPTSAIAGKVKSVELTASENIFNGGKSLKITLSTIGDEGSDGLLHLFATLPQGDQVIPAGTTLLVKFNAPNNSSHKVYTRYIEFPAAKTLTNNKVNALNISAVNSATYANSSKTDIGTESNPYIIGDVYQMQAMAGFMVAGSKTYFKLVDDVDLKGVAWTPLNDKSGDEAKGLVFDGGGHKISNLTVGDTNNYPSFAGYLWGAVNNVVFDKATITAGEGKEQSAGVVGGYIGGSSKQGDCSGVTVSNSTVTCTGGAAYIAGLGARIGKAGEFRNCHVVNTTVNCSDQGGCVGGMLAYIASNSGTVIVDCSAENIAVTGGKSHYAGGLVACIVSPNPVVINRCHTSGSVNRTAGGRHFGGLVGSVQSADVQIKNSYSTCSVTGYQFNGGLVGSWWTSSDFTGGSGRIDHCYASGTVTDQGNSGDGGLVGSLEVPGITVKNSIAWNDAISPSKYGSGNYSSGAVVARAHPNSILINNYRKPGLDITAFWVPSESFDHPDSKLVGDTYYIWRIGADGVEANGAYTEATALSTPYSVWAYHGKHLASGTKVTPDDTYGWKSNTTIPGITQPSTSDPEAAGFTGNNVWGLGNTVEIRPGVEWTNFHGQWQGEWREINIVRATLDEANRLGIFYDYSTDGLKFLNEKCVHVNAVAGVNGSMACCQFTRVNDIIKHAATSASEWTSNCALTIDGDAVDIVKVEDNFDAAMLPNHTVTCAGPLLVWKGNKLTASAEWLAADTDKWLTTSGNAGGNPRTAIGLSKDGKTVYLVAVDGRWTSDNTAHRAIGMSTDLMAELMKQLGCYKAMNMDGGGGTQMWISGKGDVNNIVNHPHNCWPSYDQNTGVYYWIKDNQVGRRFTGSAIYVY